VFPGQTEAGDADAVTVGSGLTVTVTVVDPVQPSALVPVTEYLVVEAGETVTEVVLPPVLHEYMAAPEAVSVADDP